MNEKTISKLNILKSLIGCQIRAILTQDGKEIEGKLEKVEGQQVIVGDEVLDVYDIETFFIVKKNYSADNLY
jgi:hypothetical protein